jgi:hypothetical protein
MRDGVQLEVEDWEVEPDRIGAHSTHYMLAD